MSFDSDISLLSLDSKEDVAFAKAKDKERRKKLEEEERRKANYRFSAKSNGSLKFDPLWQLKPVMSDKREKKGKGEYGSIKRKKFDLTEFVNKPTSLPNNLPVAISDYLSLIDKRCTLKQRECITKILSKKNVFLDGGAGTGKNFTISQLCKILTRLEIKFANLAINPELALNSHGYLFRNWTKIESREMVFETLQPLIRKDVEKWRNIQVLILNGIQDYSVTDLELLDTACQYLRGNLDAIFGGLTVLFCGNFGLANMYNENKEYVFQHGVWHACEFTKISLDKSFVHSLKYFTFLEKVRTGQYEDYNGDEIFDYIKNYIGHDEPTPSIVNRSYSKKKTSGFLLNGPVSDPSMFKTILPIIFPKHSTPENLNIDFLKTIEPEVENWNEFSGQETNTSDQDNKMFFDTIQSCLASERIILTIGSQVMLIEDIEVDVLSNPNFDPEDNTSEESKESKDSKESKKLKMKIRVGSIGVVVRFTNVSNKNNLQTKLLPIVKFEHSFISNLNENDNIDNIDDISSSSMTNRPKKDNGDIYAVIYPYTWAREEISDTDFIKLPLTLAWHLSAHRLSRKVLNAAYLHLDKIFSGEHLYSLLSRVSKLDDSQLSPIYQLPTYNPNIKKLFKELHTQTEPEKKDYTSLSAASSKKKAGKKKKMTEKSKVSESSD